MAETYNYLDIEAVRMPMAEEIRPLQDSRFADMNENDYLQSSLITKNGAISETSHEEPTEYRVFGNHISEAAEILKEWFT